MKNDDRIRRIAKSIFAAIKKEDRSIFRDEIKQLSFDGFTTLSSDEDSCKFIYNEDNNDYILFMNNGSVWKCIVYKDNKLISKYYFANPRIYQVQQFLLDIIDSIRSFFELENENDEKFQDDITSDTSFSSPVVSNNFDDSTNDSVNVCNDDYDISKSEIENNEGFSKALDNAAEQVEETEEEKTEEEESKKEDDDNVYFKIIKYPNKFYIVFSGRKLTDENINGLKKFVERFNKIYHLKKHDAMSYDNVRNVIKGNFEFNGIDWGNETELIIQKLTSAPFGFIEKR